MGSMCRCVRPSARGICLRKHVHSVQWPPKAFISTFFVKFSKIPLLGRLAAIFRSKFVTNLNIYKVEGGLLLHGRA